MRLPEVEYVDDNQFDEFEENDSMDYMYKLPWKEFWKTLFSKSQKQELPEDYIPEPKLSLKEKINLWRSEKAKNRQKNLENMTLSNNNLKKCIKFGVFLTTLTAIATLVVAFPITTIALPIKVILTPCLFTLFCLSSTRTKKYIHQFQNKKDCNEKNKTSDLENNNEKEDYTQKKSNIFRKIKNKFLSRKNSMKSSQETDMMDNNTNLDSEDSIDNQANEESMDQTEGTLVQNENHQMFTLHRLARPVKIKSWNVGRVRGLGIYYIAVPIDNVNAQYFIEDEIFEKMPDEKIQTFETENQKVYVLNKKPNIFE